MDGSADIEATVRLIKDRMPETYRSIQAKADEIGREAYGMVRRAIGGQANVFYAVEAGHVVGTPFDLPDITRDMALNIVRFGCRSMVLWARVEKTAQGATDGNH